MNTIERIERATELYEKYVFKLIRKAFWELFVKYPSLDSFTLKGETPSFCDGDPCYFGVDVVKINGEDEYDSETDEDNPKFLGEVSDEVYILLGELDQNLISKMYDKDYLQVTISRGENYLVEKIEEFDY